MIWQRLELYVFENRDVILAITCVLLFVYILVNKPRVVFQSDPTILKELKSYKDENGKLYTKIEQKQAEFAGDIKKYTDSVAKALRVGKTQIKEVEKVTLKVDTLFYQLRTTPVIRLRDTAYRVEKHDPWIDISAVAGKDTGSINYHSVDTITRIVVVKNPWIGRTTRTVNLTNSNPYNQIKEGSSFIIKEKQIWLTIGPSLQYSPFSGRVEPGVSIQVPILKLKR